eukprot:1151234-Pelagomonas_calceolata.AAC.5
MLGVDRLDMVKGIPQKLLAFEKFLEEHPEWRDKVREKEDALYSQRHKFLLAICAVLHPEGTRTSLHYVVCNNERAPKLTGLACCVTARGYITAMQQTLQCSQRAQLLVACVPYFLLPLLRAGQNAACA